ncbi:MAG: LuxR C-terminal-related transcriptional regulator [Cyclobacteriaceae bacterium]|nr:response regulator transcription factor [Cyclobacteriaceae bacterium]MCH8518128.1 LuxR C-terminal-related transcriptional regulator [Cyclobacteriaceae bacterium]
MIHKEGVYPHLIKQLLGAEVRLSLLLPENLQEISGKIKTDDYLLFDPAYLPTLPISICDLIEGMNCKCAVMSRDLRSQEIKRLKTAGLCCYINKHESFEGIRHGIDAFIRDQTYYSKAYENEQEEILSDREQSVIQLISHGLSTIEIADELSLSVHTINTHRKNILKKLKARTTGDMIAKAIRSRLINFNEH